MKMNNFFFYSTADDSISIIHSAIDKRQRAVFDHFYLIF